MRIRISRRTLIILIVLVVVLALAWRLSVGKAQPGAALITASPTTTPTSVAASPTVNPSPNASPVASPVVCVPTDQDQYVYNPARLQVVAACIHLTGVVAEIRTEADGDLHILLALDAAFAHLLAPGNQGVERGDMVAEPICVRSVSQTDAIEACAADPIR